MLKIKSLEVNRETLTSLDSEQETQVQGGWKTQYCNACGTAWTGSVKTTVQKYCC